MTIPIEAVAAPLAAVRPAVDEGMLVVVLLVVPPVGLLEDHLAVLQVKLEAVCLTGLLAALLVECLGVLLAECVVVQEVAALSPQPSKT